VTPILERRFGLERLAAASMLIVTAALIARSLAGDAATLLLATTVLFAAVGVGNVVPPLIKTYFPDRVGTMTALYSALLAMAAFVPPLVAVPVADAAGWRFSLGLWAIFALAAIVPWVTLVARANAARARRPSRSISTPRARRLGTSAAAGARVGAGRDFGISAASVYACFAWLPVVLVDIAGVSHAEAGALLSLFGAMGLPWSILVPILITRWRRVGVVYAVALIAGLTGWPEC
jgi:CP family cyanate transporter-like MFS transporter